MAKTKVQKEKMIEILEDRVSKMKSAVIVDYQGLKVKDTEELRGILREKGVTFNVSKNTLTKIVLKKHGIELDEGIFAKPVAIAFAMEDEVAPAKEIALYAKKNEAIEILGGILENKFIDEATVKRLAALPSRDELRGKMVGTIAAPLSGMVNVMAGNIRGLVQVLSALKETKAE
jgi:large subunit ribosomal protein L10